jgi:hypothetical protein
LLLCLCMIFFCVPLYICCKNLSVYHEDKKIGCSSLTITLLNLTMIVSSSRSLPPESLRMSRSNAEEDQEIDISGSRGVLSSRGPLWKRDLAAAWAIMDCNRTERMIEHNREDLTDTIIQSAVLTAGAISTPLSTSLVDFPSQQL